MTSRSLMKKVIINNKPIDSTLHVIAVISNPCNYKRRYQLTKEFMERMSHELNVVLYIVELVYDDQEFMVTDPHNKCHLQIRTNTPPFWHKENLINLGVKRLLPEDWKAFAWIDSDIEFENTSWALDTLKLLNTYDVVQLFSHAIDLDSSGNDNTIVTGLAYYHSTQVSYQVRNLVKFHSGYGWAMTKQLYDSFGGLYEYNILGGGDSSLAHIFVNNSLGSYSLHKDITEEYKKSLLDYGQQAKARLGYVPGIIKHYFHGDKKNRQYCSRWTILVKYKYNPNTFVTKNSQDILIPTSDCPQDLLNDIMKYFRERNEDDTSM